MPDGPFRLVTVNFATDGAEASKLGDNFAEKLATHLKGVRLTDLYLPHAQSLTTVGVATLVQLPECAGVSYLSMGGCGVDDGVFAHLAKLPNLQFVDCKVTRFSTSHDYIFAHPAALSDLILVLRDRLPPGAPGRPLLQPAEGVWELHNDYLARKN